jgi:hypothetical protein
MNKRCSEKECLWFDDKSLVPYQHRIITTDMSLYRQQWLNPPEERPWLMKRREYQDIY